MSLEWYNSESFSQKEALAEAINGLKWETAEVAADTIQNLNETQLTNFIEKSFKNNETHKWKPYSQMKKDTFYPFMVQATIDMFSNKLWDKKFDKDGNLDNENWKTLDDRIKEYGWIDNRYWPNTRKLVSTVQKILKINDDWLAGPQYFHTICSALNWSDLDDFAVEWIENYQYWIDDNIKNNLKENRESNLINALNLKWHEFNDSTFNRSDYGLPDNVQLYKTETTYDNGVKLSYYTYIEWNQAIRIPDLKQFYTYTTFTKSVYKNWKRTNSYELSNNKNISEFLNYNLKKELENVWLSTWDKEIKWSISAKKYYLESFWHITYIDDVDLENGWIFKENKNFPRELKMMNLCNYLRDIYKDWRYADFVLRKWYDLVIDRPNDLDADVIHDSDFKKYYWILSDAESKRFTDYLNKKINKK